MTQSVASGAGQDATPATASVDAGADADADADAAIFVGRMEQWSRDDAPETYRNDLAKRK